MIYYSPFTFVILFVLIYRKLIDGVKEIFIEVLACCMADHLNLLDHFSLRVLCRTLKRLDV